MVNRGESPVKAEDPEVDPMIARCVKEKKTLTATFNNECLKLADCVVVDVQCDFTKHDLGNMRTGEAEMGALEATIRTIGQKRPAALPDAHRNDRRPGHDRVRGLADHEEGVCRPRHHERAAACPQFRAGDARPRLRLVDPRFLARLFRLQRRSPPRVEKFLREVLNTEHFPLTVMDRPIESETDQDHRELLPGGDLGVYE